jgi:two-component system, sporulation sensor kinase E
VSNNSKDRDIGKLNPFLVAGAEFLKSSETAFRSLFENSPVGIVISRDGVLTYANPAFLYMFGLNETSKLHGEALMNYIAPISHGTKSPNMYGSNEEEAIGLRKDGTLFPVQINAFRISLLDGPASATFITNITERKQAEDELKLRAQLLDAANDSIVVHDLTGRFLFVNEAACRLYGYTKAKMMQKNVFDLNTPEYKQLWESRASVLKEKGRLVFEAINARKSDLNTVLEVNARLIEGTGGNALVLSVSRDISERKQTEEALRQSEERFSRAFHSSPCAMSITHLPDFRIIDANQRWLGMTGFSLEDVVGKLREDMNIWTEQQHQQAEECLNEYGAVDNRETVFRNKKGEERYGLWSGEIITLDGEPCLLGATIDITERKGQEKEIARLDRFNLMGEIAAGIAHEIRNPITVVRGYLQMMRHKEEFASHKKRFDTMMEEIDRANAIITEFLSLAKYAPPDLKRQSINSILTDLLPLIQADAAEHGIVISLSLSDVPEINLDSKQIRQVVLNLVRNGIEAMSRYGELTIRTRLKRNRVVLSIKDRGNGIAPEVLENLGKPFFTTKEKGTGLGLPVCYRIAESHNAKIEIKTGRRGTIFMVSFPLPSPQDGVSV